MLKLRSEFLARLPMVLIAVATIAVPVFAAADVLTLVPEKTLGFAVVNGLTAVNEKLGKQVQELQLPVPDLLTLAKTRAGIQQGLDEDGNVLVAVASSVDGSVRIQDSEGLIAFPVSDYKQFVEQFEGDASEKITELKMSGKSMLAAQKSGYAVVVPADSEHRRLLQKVLERNADVPAEVAPLKTWIRENDVAIVILSPGIKVLTDQGIEALEKLQEQFSGMPALGDKAAQVTAVFDMYLHMLRVIQAEVHTAADGLRIDAAGNFRFGGRVRFTEGGRAASISVPANHSSEELLAGLPAGPFVGAVGTSLSPECTEALVEWSIRMMKNNPALYGVELSDEAADNYLQLTLESMKGLRGFSMMMSAKEVDQAVLDGVLGIIRTDDSAAYLAKYEKAITQYQEIFKGSKFPYQMDVAEDEIAGVKGLKLTMDMGAAMAAQGSPPQAAQVFEKLFGEGGKMVARIFPIDMNTVLFSYGSVTTVEQQIADLKGGGPGLAQDASIQKTAALLPEDTGLVGYLSPGGAVTWFKNIATKFGAPDAVGDIPEFPATPAVGISAKMVTGGLETEMVVPAELPKAVKQYVGTVRQ